MKSRYLILIALALLGTTACESRSAGKTIVTVNGGTITDGNLTFLAELNPRTGAQLATEFGRQQVVANLVEQELLYQASQKRGIENDPKVKAKIDLYRKVIIAQAYVDHELEVAARDYYTGHSAEFERLGLAHIMIKFGDDAAAKGAKKGKAPARTEAAALELATKIKGQIEAGKKFEDLAKEFSDDELSKARGGDLGWVTKEDPRINRRGMGELLEKAATLKVGDVAGPIKSEGAFHIIKLAQGREMPTFDEVSPRLSFKLKGEIRKKVMDQLKADAKIAYIDKSAAPAPTPAPAAPASAGDSATPP